MSFNSNDINSFINRENYEEYFLLLVDNELTTEEEAVVKSFLAAHPDLQPEMDLLLCSKLPAEETGFLNKEILFAESMRLNQVEESLLLYIDQELNEEDSKWLEDKLSADAQLQAQHQQFLKTKLDAADHLTYPFKKELYRREERKKIPFSWMRVAAAVLVVISIGGLIYKNQQPHSTSIAVIVAPPIKERPTIEVKIPVMKPAQDLARETKKRIDPLNVKEVNKEVGSLAKHKSPRPVREYKIAPDNKSKSSNNIEPLVTQKALDNSMAVTPEQNLPKQSLNNTPVTKGTVASYNSEEAPLTPAAIRDALVKTDNEKKSSLKGLLRKATRFIERRTNISATNENDELLIGAVALKL